MNRRGSDWSTSNTLRPYKVCEDDSADSCCDAPNNFAQNKSRSYCPDRAAGYCDSRSVKKSSYTPSSSRLLQAHPSYLRSSGSDRPSLYNYSEPSLRASGGAIRKEPVNNAVRRSGQCRSKSEARSQSRSMSLPRSKSGRRGSCSSRLNPYDRY